MLILGPLGALTGFFGGRYSPLSLLFQSLTIPKTWLASPGFPPCSTRSAERNRIPHSPFVTCLTAGGFVIQRQAFARARTSPFALRVSLPATSGRRLGVWECAARENQGR